jgi:hypothetical protein
VFIRNSMGAMARTIAPFVAVLMVAVGGALAANEAKYPNWKGRWDTINLCLGGQSVKFDPNKPFGPAQQAPLTPEYQNIHEESMADQAKGPARQSKNYSILIFIWGAVCEPQSFT